MRPIEFPAATSKTKWPSFRSLLYYPLRRTPFELRIERIRRQPHQDIHWHDEHGPLSARTEEPEADDLAESFVGEPAVDGIVQRKRQCDVREREGVGRPRQIRRCLNDHG